MRRREGSTEVSLPTAKKYPYEGVVSSAVV